MKRHLLRKHILLITWLASAATAGAADGPDAGAVPLLKKSTDRFMDDLGRDKPKEAFERLFGEWWIAPETVESAGATLLAQLQAQGSWQKKFEKGYGKPLPESIEFLGTKRMGTRMVRLGYLAKGERAPCEFRFDFYRTAGGWKMNGINIGAGPARELAHALGVSALDVTAPGEIELKKATSAFLENIAKGEAKPAIEKLFKDHWYNEQTLSEDMDEMISAQRLTERQIKDQVGKPRPEAIEFVGSIRTGKDCLHLIYLEHYERDGVPWEFSFYRGATGWKLLNVSRSANDEAMAEDFRRFGVTEAVSK